MLLNRDSFHTLGGDTTFRDHPPSELSAGCMAVPLQNNFQVQSPLYGGATTSGRPAATTGVFVSSLYSQSVEFESLVRLQMESLQSGMKVLRRKHCRDLLSAVQQQAVKRLRVKEVELESSIQRNRELEEQLLQMSADCQVWFNYANTTESVVSDLRAKLDNVLTYQNTCPAAVDTEEGCGDSGGDAESVCEADNSKRACKVCREREVCVVLLPCRHLCLCKGCEAMIDTCPVCNSTRNASIHVVDQ